MASKIGRRKAAGTSGLKTPEEVSTRMGTPCMEISETRSAEEVYAHWQFGQAGCAAASAAKSTGGGGQESSAVAAGTRDLEGAFTPVDLGAAAPGPPMAAMGLHSGEAARPMGGPGICGPAVAGGAEDPEGTFTSACLCATSPGPLKAVAGRERVSATKFSSVSRARRTPPLSLSPLLHLTTPS